MKKMRPEQINQVAEDLLRSFAVLKEIDRHETGESLPDIPFTLADVSKTPGVQRLRFTGHPHLFTQGALFGWLYVCFVWLREADRNFFDRAIQDRKFMAQWTPFLTDWVHRWTHDNPQDLEHMLEHFRHAIAHGNIYINFDEVVERGNLPRIWLTSRDKNDTVTAQFRASFTDLTLFGEAVYDAHTAAVKNIPYGTVTRPRLSRIRFLPIPKEHKATSVARTDEQPTVSEGLPAELFQQVIEIRPYGDGWQCIEGPFAGQYWRGGNAKESAIDYAKGRAKVGRGEIRVLKRDGSIEQVITFNQAQVD